MCREASDRLRTMCEYFQMETFRFPPRCRIKCIFPFAMVAEHGEQRHLQGPAHHGVKALLQGGPLQQADDRRPAHVSPGHHHREQDSGSYRHLYRTPAAGSSRFPDPSSTDLRGASNHPMCLRWQLVLTRSSPIIFANYSLVENQRVSSIAAVYSSEYLLFVVGDKVRPVDKWASKHDVTLLEDMISVLSVS